MAKELTARQMARQVEKMLGDKVYEVQSSSSNRKYEVLVSSADGRISCPCQGWCTKKPNKARFCSHCRQVVERQGMQLVIRGDYFVVIVEQGQRLRD
jgi:hypothetical protein